VGLDQYWELWWGVFWLDIFSFYVQGLSIVKMGDIKWRDVKKILRRHEEVNQVNNQALHNINSKLSKLEQVVVGSVANSLELLQV